MSDEETPAEDAPVEETAESAEEPAAEAAGEEPPAADADDAANEAPAEEVAAEEAPAEEAPADEPVAEEASDDVGEEAPSAPAGDPATARVFLTEHGYRVVSLWSEPEEVVLKEGRHGEMVAQQLYPVGNLPEKVQRALNPLKASKKNA